MSKSNSISAAIRRRSGNTTSSSSSSSSSSSNNTITSDGSNQRLTYYSVLKMHELRLRDIEELMKETLLISQEEHSNKILELEETINNLTSELKLMNEKLESNNNDENNNNDESNNMDNSDNE